MPSAAEIKAGAAYVELYLRDNRFTRGLAAAKRKLKAMGTSFTRVGTAVTAAGGAILAPILASAKAFAAAGDALDKMSVRVGASVPFLSALGHAANLGGTDIAAMETGIRRMQRTAYDATRGLSTATAAFGELGISVLDANGELKSTEALFMESATALSKLENNTKKAALATVIFGRAGTSLLPMLRDGERGLVAAMTEAKALGLVLSREDATAAANLTDAMARLHASMKAVFIRVGAALAGPLTEFGNRAAKIGADVIAWVRQNQGLIVSIIKLAAGTMAAGAAIYATGLAAKITAAAIGLLLGTITTLATVTGALLSPIGLVSAAVVALGVTLVKVSGQAGRVLDWLQDRFTQLGNWAKTVWQGMADGLMAGDLSAAANVAWTGLQLAWETGISKLLSAWIDFKFAVADIFTETLGGLKVQWFEFNDWLSRQLAVASGMDVAGAEARNRQIAELTGRPVGKPSASGQAAKATADALAASKASRRAAHGSLEAGLAESQAAFDAALAAAAEARRRAEIGSAPAPAYLAPGMLDQALADAGGGTRGTFSAAAAGLLGGTNELSDIAKNTGRMDKKLEQLWNRIDRWAGFPWDT